MEPEGSLPCLQEPGLVHILRHESNPHPPNLFKIHSVFPSTPGCSEWSVSLGFSNQKSVYIYRLMRIIT